MGFFSKMSQIKTYDSSQYFTEGQYVVKIGRTKLVDGHKGESFVIETEVLGSRGDGEEVPLDVGAIASHVWSATGAKKEMALSNWKLFLTAAYDISDPLNDEQWEDLSDSTMDDNALAGTKMYLQVFNITTKSGNPFTKHKWVRRATEDDLTAFGVK